jgi:hypothetical protein
MVGAQTKALFQYQKLLDTMSENIDFFGSSPQERTVDDGKRTPSPASLHFRYGRQPRRMEIKIKSQKEINE